MTININIPKEFNFLIPIEVNKLIRVGNKNDGGYVVPEEIISRSNFLLSFGLNDDWTFEEEFLKYSPNAYIHVYDHSVSKKFFLNKFKKTLYRVLRGKFFYIKQLNSDWILYNSYLNFFRGNIKHIIRRISDKNHSELDISIISILEEMKSDKVFLKMDIEGAEYRVIQHLVNYSQKILGMVIEFHDCDPLRLTFTQSIKQLQSKYSIVHIHPNNHAPISEDGLPESLEITLIRNDFLPSRISHQLQLPIKDLDRPCNPLIPEYSMIFNI